MVIGASAHALYLQVDGEPIANTYGTSTSHAWVRGTDVVNAAITGATKKVSDAIDKLKCTRIVIAHRLSTIQHADRIIYLDSGRIVEEGTYAELIAKNGYFAELVERQRLDVDQ